jgi:hypothetical protein
MSKLSPEELRLLYLFEAYLDSMSGGEGTKVYSGTGANTGLSLKALSVRETPTSFTSLAMSSGAGKTVLTEADIFVGGVVDLQQGDLIRPPQGYTITAFELASGSVLGT